MSGNNAYTFGIGNRTTQNVTNIYNEKKTLISSLMPKFIEILYEKVIIYSQDVIKQDDIPDKFDVEDKIVYNDLKKYRGIAEDYGTYYSCCKDSLNSLDDTYFNSKQRILLSINEYYKEEKRILLTNLDNIPKDSYESIRSNSDKIIDNIKDKLENNIKKDYNGENICSEDIEYCLPIFLCFAFMECKILEKRPKR